MVLMHSSSSDALLIMISRSFVLAEFAMFDAGSARLLPQLPADIATSPGIDRTAVSRSFSGIAELCGLRLRRRLFRWFVRIAEIVRPMPIGDLRQIREMLVDVVPMLA
jgi:hypothetical protein